MAVQLPIQQQQQRIHLRILWYSRKYNLRTGEETNQRILTLPMPWQVGQILVSVSNEWPRPSAWWDISKTKGIKFKRSNYINDYLGRFTWIYITIMVMENYVKPDINFVSFGDCWRAYSYSLTNPFPWRSLVSFWPKYLKY